MTEFQEMDGEGDNLSIVVQGPIVNAGGATRRALASFRRFLPRSEIIVSTWEGNDCTGLDYDRLVLCADPGGITRAVSPACPWPDWRARANNVTRQIVSTKSGLAKVQRPFSMKVRTDFCLTSNRIAKTWLESLEHFERVPEWKVFSSRLVILNIAWPNHHAQLFHPSDLLALGRTGDVRKLWEIDESPAFAEADYFVRNPPPRGCSDPWWLSRYLPEQFVWVSCLQKGLEVPFADRWDHTEESRRASDLSVVNNFYCVNQSTLGVKWLIAKRRWDLDDSGSELTWHQHYRRLCKGRQRIPLHAYASELVRWSGVMYQRYKYWRAVLERRLSLRPRATV